MEPRNERLSGQLTHYTQQKGVPYDYVPEVHAYARIIEKNLAQMGKSSIKIITKNLILQHKYITLTNFRRLKN